MYMIHKFIETGLKKYKRFFNLSVTLYSAVAIQIIYVSGTRLA